MKVCFRCLLGIENHEGKQNAVTLYVDETIPEESRCEFCGEIGHDVLYELFIATE